MTMPAGTYYIGDLCYVMHEAWDEFCKITINGNECLDGEFELADGRRFATYGTAYGDGEYEVSNGGKVGVDAGLVGCIRIEDIKPGNMDPQEAGVVVTFAHPFETGTARGVIFFGDVSVDTDPQPDEDYWPEEDYDAEDEGNIEFM